MAARQQSDETSLGARLRAARETSGLTLSEVARRASLGKGTVSELEHDRREPRLETLWALATAIGVPLASFLDQDAGEPIEGAAVSAIPLASWTTDAHYELYRAVIGPALQTSPAHAPGVEETITVISGSLKVGRVGEERTIGPGECLRFTADTPHVYAAVGAACEALILIHYGRG